MPTRWTVSDATQALRAASDGSPDELLRSLFGANAGEERDARWLTMWSVVSTVREPDALIRPFAFALAKELAIATPTPVVRACVVWSVSTWRGEDIGACANMLTAIEFAAQDDGPLRSELRSSVGGFVRHCLEHPARSVQEDAVDTLSVLVQSAGVETFVHRALAQVLSARVSALIDGLDAPMRVFDALRSAQIPDAAPVEPRALQRLGFDVEDRPEAEAAALVRAVRRRALLDQAGADAAAEATAVHTVRFASDQAPVRALDALWRFADVVCRPLLVPEDREQGGIEMRARAAAPASFPIHTLLEPALARAVFDALVAVFSDKRTRAQLADAFAALDPSVVDAAASLVSQLEASNADVEIVLTVVDALDWQRSLSIPAASLPRVREALAAARRSPRPDRTVRVVAADVPQANTVAQVFQATDAVVARGGRPRVTDIANITVDRQVNYYLHGARVLGLLDEENQPTDRARALRPLDAAGRLRLAAIYFEDAAVGRAWRRWAGADALPGIDPMSASAFLTECVVGLGFVTLGRRASTLRRWWRELAPHHPAASAGGPADPEDGVDPAPERDDE